MAKRKDKVFCSKKCVWDNSNNNRPRLTNKSYKLANLAKNIPLTSTEKEIIYGTLMGDGCLILQTDNFHRLSLCHCKRQLEYILFKKKCLNNIFLNQECKPYTRKDGKVQFNAHSISHKDLTNIYGLFYRSKKKFISRKLLNLLTPTSLIFWYLDDGSLMKASGNAAIFCTDSFTLSEVKAIKIWFWQKFRVETNIMTVSGGFSDKQYYRLRLNQENTNKLFSIMMTSPHFNQIPQSMKYKFGC